VGHHADFNRDVVTNLLLRLTVTEILKSFSNGWSHEHEYK